MDRHQFDTEAREEQLIEATRAQFSTLSRAVLAGDPVATKRIADALGEYVADTHAAADLVHAVLLNSQAALKVITGLIWTEAGELAEVEVKRAEQHRAESHEENRIDQAAWARAVH